MARRLHRQGEALIIGDYLRRRSGESISALSLADELLESLPVLGTTTLDQYLGPFCGVLQRDSPGRASSLYVFRDRFGTVPIQYLRLERGWAISTSPEAILTLLSQKDLLQVHRPRLESFLFGSDDQGSEDFFRDLYRLRPGEVLYLEGNSIKERCYFWNPEANKPADSETHLRKWFARRSQDFSLRPHLLALSSGMDSGALAAYLTSRHGGSEAITLYDSKGVDERGVAQEIATHLGIRWRCVDIADHWPRASGPPPLRASPLAWGPESHPDMAWKDALHRSLRKVPYSLPIVYGNGADEALWISTADWLQSRWRAADYSALYEANRHLPAGRVLRALLGGLSLPDFLSRLRSRDDDPWSTPQNWVHRFSSTDGPLDWEPCERAKGRDRFLQLRSWRWERVMRSLARESRCTFRPILTPYLDAEFWELCFSLRPDERVVRGRQKAVLRSACADLLPSSVLSQPKKGGFDPLVERGLAMHERPAIEEMMSQPLLSTHLSFSSPCFLSAYRAYCDASRERIRGSWPIWRTLSSEVWSRQLAATARFSGGNS